MNVYKIIVLITFVLFLVVGAFIAGNRLSDSISIKTTEENLSSRNDNDNDKDDSRDNDQSDNSEDDEDDSDYKSKKSSSSKKSSYPKKVKKSKSTSYSYINYANNAIYDSVYYCVYTEACIYQSNAEKASSALSKKNVASNIIYEDGYYKVMVGITEDFDKAKSISKEVENRGFDTYILGYSDYYDDKVTYLQNLAYNYQRDQFLYEYNNVISQLNQTPVFGRYNKILEKLYQDYFG